MTLVNRPDGELVLVAGASRSGKTTYVTQLVRPARRLLLWDSADDGRRYDCELIGSPAELRDRLARPPRLERLAYQPRDARAEFDYFCRLAWVFIRQARSALVVEELADVTHPGKAPPAWGAIVRKGLRYGPLIVAVTQRPSESDKTALGNATRVRCFRVVSPNDQRRIGGLLGVDPVEVQTLRPFEWIERDVAGRVTYGAGQRRRATRASPRAFPRPASS